MSTGRPRACGSRRPIRVMMTGTVTSLLVALTVACGPPPGTGSVGETVTADRLPTCPLDALAKAQRDPKAGPITVMVWHGLGAEPEKALTKIASDFNASQSGIKVVVQNQGKSYAEVLRKYEAAVASKSNLPGIAYLEDTTVQSLVDGGTILPAESCMRASGFDMDQIRPAIRSYYTVNGVYWAGYPNVSQPILYYNRNHYRKAGLDPDKPPRTLKELRAHAVALKKAGIPRPLALMLNAWFFESWVNGAGADVVEPDNGRGGPVTKATLDSPQAREILTFFRDMVRDGLAQPISATDGQVNQFLAVAQQNSSLLFETSAASTSIKAFLGGNLDTGGVDVSGKVDLNSLDPASALLPGLTAPGLARTSGGAFFIVNRVAPKIQAAAWKFLEFMHRPEQAKGYFLRGSYLPVTQAVADDPEVLAFMSDDLAGRLLQVASDQLDEIDPKRPGPLIGPYPAYTDAVKNAQEEVMFNGKDPAKALKDANSGLDAAITAYNG